MNSVASDLNDHDAIVAAVSIYVDGAKKGSGVEMRGAFREDATIFGFSDGSMFAGPIKLLFDAVDQEAPATGLKARFVQVDIVGTIADVQLELDDWNGVRYTDFMTLLKDQGSWKIMTKAFHQHSNATSV